MDRRRRQARAQVERLRVGRDRLLRSYEVVRRTLDETTVELKLSLKEAKVRGDTAARTVASEPLASRQQLESELADAKLIGRVSSKKSVLDSPALPRPIAPPEVPNIDLRVEGTEAPKPKRPRVEPKAKRVSSPTPPAAAPIIKQAAIEAELDDQPVSPADDEDQPSIVVDLAPEIGVEAPIDDELASLADDNLDIVEPCDEIEKVVALDDPDLLDAAPDVLQADLGPEPGGETEIAAPLHAHVEVSVDQADAAPDVLQADLGPEPEPDEVAEAAPADNAVEPDAPAPGLFAALREQASAPEPESEPESEIVIDVTDLTAQRDAIVADAASQLERRLKRALADEQNELLAAIRAAKKRDVVVLVDVVGDTDTHVTRYVMAIHEVAAVVYGAGVALVDGESRTGELPAGAVEDLLSEQVTGPIRARLTELDAIDVASYDEHLDPIRGFYRQRKTDHLGQAAVALARLLCTAGACDGLPTDTPLPWAGATS